MTARKLAAILGTMPFALDDEMRRILSEHFSKRKVAWTEDALLGVLRSGRSAQDVHLAVVALRDQGTARALPVLERQLHHENKDVRCTAILTIAHIAGATATPLYAAALLDPAYRDKGYAMTAIDDAADGRAVEAVLAHFRKHWPKIRRGAFHDGTFAEGLQYLGRHVGAHPDIASFFEDLLTCWERLPATERRGAQENVAWFRDRQPG